MKSKIVIYDSAPFLPVLFGVNVKEYYKNVKVKLETQSLFIKRYEEVITMIPGIWADFGTIVEPSAFGSEIVWFENDAPFSKPCIKSLDQIKKLKIINPKKDGLMPVALEQYKYMWENIDKDLIYKIGYLNGIAYTMGPLETAGLIMGYENFFIEMCSNPKKIKDLIKKITEGLIKWLYEQQKVNGKMKILIIPDHVPSLISEKHFLEFGLNSFKEIFGEFHNAKKLWHNEGKVTHISKYIDEIGCDVYHCGDNISELQRQSKKVIFMGNLHPIEIILKKNAEEVIMGTQKLLNDVPDHERLWVSTGGGLAPGTKFENIDAIVKGVEIFYKNKKNN